MHEVAISTSGAIRFVKLPAAGLTEVRYWGVFHFKLARRIKTAVKCLKALRCIFFVFEFDINIANDMVSKILAHVQFFNLAMLGHLLINLFVEIVEVVLKLLLVHSGDIPSCGRYLRLGVDPHVLDQNRLRKWGFVMLPGASIAVTARADLKIERTVHAVFFGTMDASKVRGAS